jgi:YesN/AraC family two-component response regulator
MDGYLAKPIERDRLQDLLARLESELASAPKGTAGVHSPLPRLAG